MKKLLVLLLAASLLSGSGMIAVAQSEAFEMIDASLAAAPHTENEVLVKVTAPAASLFSLRRDSIYEYEPESEQTLFAVEEESPFRLFSAAGGNTSWKLLRYPEGTDLRAVMQSMAENPYVEGVMPNYIVTLPEPMETEAETGQDKTSFAQNQWYLSRLNMEQAREYLRLQGANPYGDPTLVVACVDAGIDVTHPALKNALWVNQNETPGDGKDNDGNRYIDDVHGYNFSDKNGDVTDATNVAEEQIGHGTTTAGIIAAKDEEGQIEGIAPNVKLMECKVFGGGGNTIAMVAEAINYAAANGADIINLSVGIPVTDVASAAIQKVPVLEDAIKKNAEKVIIVASAGNDAAKGGYPNEPVPILNYAATTQIYPAVYSNVVGVMAEGKMPDSGGYLPYWSMWDAVAGNEVEYEVMAPGQEIFTTKKIDADKPTELYRTASGTSYAAPMVSGIFALMRTLYPDKEKYPNSFLVQQFLNSCSYKLGKSYLGANNETVTINYRSANAFRALTGGEPVIHKAAVTDEGTHYRVTQTVSNPDGRTDARLLVSAVDGDGVCQAVYGSTLEQATEYDNVTFECTVPKNESYQTLRIMLWGRLDQLDPFTEAANIDCKDIKPFVQQ